MFLFSYRGVVLVLVLLAFYSYLTISGRYSAVEPWINGVLLVLISLLFVRTWLG
ncbi:MAG TPA: hypothetical protein VIW95_12530 [Candidatus Binatus sp.]|uniref:hypothetical protein n=1 Tax=Candidatus Binatus sp. TaxID=2811406 RepID=UPI002F428991